MPGYLAGTSEVRSFLAAGLHAAPPPGALADERFTLAAQEYLDAVALDLADERWAATVPAAVGAEAVPADLGRNAAHEVLTATAATLAQERHGQVLVDLPEAEQAARRLDAYVVAAGFAGVVRVFCAVAAFEDLQAVAFHNPMPEEAFLSGRSHRPWAAYPLHDDLLMAAAAGMLRLEWATGPGRRIWVTPHGQAVLEALRATLAEAGALAWRRHQLAVSCRDSFVLEAAGTSAAQRREEWEETLDAAGIAAGARVLVLGLASGADGFLHELALRVGARGQVLVVDPAVAILRHFSTRLSSAAPIRLLPGRFEALPLAAGSVDAALAPPFLHIAAHDAALVELRRVVRSGGRLVLGVPHAVDTGHALLREWLEPLLDIAARLELPAPAADIAAEAAQALQRQGFSAWEVRPHSLPWAGGDLHGTLLHLLHGSDLGRRVLERTPWQQRHDLLRHLVERGERALARAEAAGEALLAPGQLVLATVP